MRFNSNALVGWSALASALALGLALPPSAAPQDANTATAPSGADPAFVAMRERFEGVWELTTPSARQVVDRGIDQAVGAMNFFVRSVARGQLRDNTPINRRITFRFLDGNRVRVHFSQTNWRATSRIGRTARTRSTDGADMRVTQRFRGESLEQVFETDLGTRWNTYSRTGPETLRLDAVTNGTMMPESMRFSLSYRRRGAD